MKVSVMTLGVKCRLLYPLFKTVAYGRDRSISSETMLRGYIINRTNGILNVTRTGDCLFRLENWLFDNPYGYIKFTNSMHSFVFLRRNLYFTKKNIASDLPINTTIVAYSDKTLIRGNNFDHLLPYIANGQLLSFVNVARLYRG